MFQILIKNYKRQMTNSILGTLLTSVMVVLFISFTILMVEYAIPSSDINVVIKLGFIYFFVNALRSAVTFFEDISRQTMAREVEADYREKIYVHLQESKQSEIDQLKVG